MYFNDHHQFPFFYHDSSCYPTRDQQLNFIRAYIDETRKIRAESNQAGGQEASDSDLDEERILKEANHFALASHMVAVAMSINLAASTKDKFSHLVIWSFELETFFLIEFSCFFSLSRITRCPEAFLTSGRRRFCSQTVSKFLNCRKQQLL